MYKFSAEYPSNQLVQCSFFYLQATLAVIQASEDTPKKPNPIKDDPKVIAEARQARQYGPYDNNNNNEVVVDIQDAEKKQYYETNYDTSKYIYTSIREFDHG